MLGVYVHHTDPAHGWLEVRLVELEELGIIDDISGCSYVQGINAYLEEDGDSTTFFEAYEEEVGEKPEIINRHTNNTHKIRRYRSYDPEEVRGVIYDLPDILPDVPD